MGERIGVTDEEWAIIGPLLPPERGRWAQDNRRYFEGMPWIARTGSQWRQLPDEYGKMQQRLPSLSAMDGTGCLRCTGGKPERIGRSRTLGQYGRFDDRPGASLRSRLKKGTQDQEALGRSRGGFSSKIHARCDGKGRPLGFVLTPGQAHDAKGFMTLLRMIADKIDALLADKGYDSDAIRDALAELEIEAVIPPKSNRKVR